MKVDKWAFELSELFRITVWLAHCRKMAKDQARKVNISNNEEHSAL